MITDPATPRGETTRDKLLDAGLRLFAARGFRATTVGEIEAAAGLRPRRGALYRHFRSKMALLDAAVRLHLDAVHKGREWILQREPSDIHTEAMLLGRFILDELSAQRPITEILEREGDRIPELRERFRRHVSDASYTGMSEVLHRWLGERARADTDFEAHGTVLVGSLVNVHRSTWTLGGTPLDLPEQRLLVAWADQCVMVVAASRGDEA